MGVVAFLKRMATSVGRRIERALTGQTDYAVITSELADFDAVIDMPKAKRVLAEVRAILARDYAIEVRAPVLIELFDEDGTTAAALRYLKRGAVGCYRTHPMGEASTHVVHLLRGLRRKRFKAVLAHELVHAYEREAGILTTNRSLREGFARWIEYNVLMGEGETREAEKLTRVRRWTSGRSIHDLLAIQQAGGIAAVLGHVRAIP